jgi:allophanate hydrolase subunit 2
MGLRADIIQGLEKYEITKIEGQPTEEDLTQLILELSSALGSVATTLGGGEHGHVGLIIDETEYVTFSRNGDKFIAPTNPGAYPASSDADAVVREQQIAEHKAKQDEFVTHQAVGAFARQAIAKAVEPEWLAEIKSDTMGYNHLTP